MESDRNFLHSKTTIIQCFGVLPLCCHRRDASISFWVLPGRVQRNMIATGHRLWGSEIVGQDLRDASFDNCDLFGVAFRQCDLRGATFRNTVLTGLIVDDCTWENNDFTNAVINGIVRQFEDDFTGVTNESLLTTWSFKNKDLSKCYIPSDGGTGYDFSQFGANFEDAVVTNTTFWECTGLTREQIFSTWNSKARRMNGIVLPKE